MTDLRTLDSAFAELERRADNTPASAHPLTPPARSHAPHGQRGALVAASVVGVAVLAGGAVLIAGTGDQHTQNGAAPSRSATSAPATSSAPRSSSQATIAPAHHFSIPRTSAELERDFRAVLQGQATFTVTYSEGGGTAQPAPSSSPPTISAPSNTRSPNPSPPPSSLVTTPGGPLSSGSAAAPGAASEPYLKGRITVARHRGGFDLQIIRADRAQKAFCGDPDRAHCTVQTLRDGTSLALSSESLAGARGSTTYMADYVRSDGAEILIHVSNQVDPKGDSPKLGANVPLTLTQLSSIVRSTGW